LEGGVTEISARRSATRDRLVEAALGVFAEKGVVGASVEEISEAAGFTRGAFYSNFESKDELCLAALDRFVAEGLAATKDAIASLEVAQPQTLDELVRHAISAFLEAQPSDRVSVLAGAELQLYAAREESFAGPYAAHAAGTGLTFARIIEDAAAQFGQRLAVPAEEAIGVLATVYISSALNALIAGPDASVDVSSVLSAVLASMLRPA
jgi:AcrR family transcriptional regulator